LDNEAYARYRGKLYKGSASLGVTAGSWKQSRDMIISRTNHARRTVDSAIGRLERNPGALKRLKKEREPLAGQVLEVEFGWRPLFADVHAALSTVCSNSIPSEYVTGRAKRPIFVQERTSDGSTRVFVEYAGFRSCSYSVKVAIENENLWLLNRLGLINPFAVGWDLIPWSFVVNMVTNMGQLVNSVTDEVGLTCSDQVITRSLKVLREHTITGVSPTGKYYSNKAITNIALKQRSVGVPLRPKFSFKLPDLNWELAVIATSLLVQRVKVLNKLIRLI
jgi:hypothetical protein